MVSRKSFTPQGKKGCRLAKYERVSPMDEPWTAETIRKVRERAEMCRAEAELASGARQKELLETALAYERMIERTKRHFGLGDE